MARLRAVSTIEAPSRAVEAVRDEDDFDVVVERTRGFPSVRPRELWAYRELLYFLTWRDIKVRYKQTLLGVSWAVLQPVLAMILFTIVFGHVARISSSGIPYPIFAYSALVPWYFFSTALQSASNSLVGNAQLVTKVYFPRIFVVASPVLGAAVDLVLAFVILVGLQAYYGIGPSIGAFALPALVLLAAAAATGLGAWLAALNVKYRDVRFVVPFLVQLWLFATPIVYSIDKLHEPWRTLFGVNPMAGVVLGFRWALAGAASPPGLLMLVSVLSGLVVLAAGVLYFGRTEKTFADVI
jgi:lipopolysaccharide transport system permease protein